MYNLPRLPVRFISENADLLKSQTDEVDLKKGAEELASVQDTVRKGLLAKNMEALSGGHAGAGTDWSETEHVASVPAGVEPQFRAPGDRNIGNVLFRRHPDGSLDVDAAKHVVVDMVHKVKDKLPLTELEKITLGILFPMVFEFVDPRLSESMMRVHLRLTPWEVALVNERVAAHLTAEMSYNAGLGGGGDPGRAVARS
jgi:hypothetical protein